MHQKSLKGFSLVEIIVVIAIIAVLSVITIPMVLNYLEKSKAEKDETAMSELVNTISLSASDANCGNELLYYTTNGNVSCYIDVASESSYSEDKQITKVASGDWKEQYRFNQLSRQADESAYYAAGNMSGVTLTFQPKDNYWIISDAIINKYIRSDTSPYNLTVDRKNDTFQYYHSNPDYKFTPTLKSMCDSTETGSYLYNSIIKAMGEKIPISSKTYRNSEFTVFIRYDNSIEVYGQFNGTNLSEQKYNHIKTPEPGTYPQNDDNMPNGQDTDSDGGGDHTVPEKPLNPIGDSYLDKSLFQKHAKDIKGQISFIDVPALPRGDDLIDLSKDNNGSILMKIQDGNAFIYGVGGVKAPDDCHELFNWTFKTNAIDCDGLYTKHVKDMSKMFSELELNSLDIHRLDTSSAVTMEGMFMKTKVPALNLNHFSNDHVEDMSNMFSECEINEIRFGDFGTDAVESMIYMFQRCKCDKIDISNFNTSNVTNMHQMFYNSFAKTIILNDLDVGKVTDMSYMFQNCKSVQSLSFGKWNTESVESMRGMFWGCDSLTDIQLDFNTSNVDTMESMFTDCKSLMQLDLTSFNTSATDNLSWMFSNCHQLKTLDLSNFNTENVLYMHGMFNGCHSLSQLDISSFDISKALSLENMFFECRSLPLLDLSNFKTSSITNISRAFQGCSVLSEINMSNCDFSSINEMDGAVEVFYLCNPDVLIYCKDDNNKEILYKSTNHNIEIANFLIKEEERT